jgi:hypothetical protein
MLHGTVPPCHASSTSVLDLKPDNVMAKRIIDHTLQLILPTRHASTTEHTRALSP